MCTIITASRELFAQHSKDFIDQIYDDAKHNPHGLALVLMGKTSLEITVLRTLSADAVVSALNNDKTWQRFWFHSRYATSSFKGIPGCHGFHARHGEQDWYVLHNGIIQHQESRKFNVDSEWLASMISRYGVAAAVGAVRTGESFVNAFFVNPTTGKWVMLRAKSGSLYQDGKGNFSTVKLKGIIEELVKDETYLEFKETVETAYYSTRGSVYGRDTSTNTAPATTPTTHRNPGTTSIEERKKRAEGMWSVLASIGPDWVQTAKGVWARKNGDVIEISGTKPTPTTEGEAKQA